MKRLLLPLLAALALPNAVNAESYWLILTFGNSNASDAAALEKIEMVSSEECEKEGRKWENSSTQGLKSSQRRFHCVKGK